MVAPLRRLACRLSSSSIDVGPRSASGARGGTSSAGGGTAPARRGEPQQPAAQPQAASHRGDEPAPAARGIPRAARSGSSISAIVTRRTSGRSGHGAARGRCGSRPRRAGVLAGVGREVLALVVAQQREVAVVRRRQALDAHQLAEPGGDPRDATARAGRAAASRRCRIQRPGRRSWWPARRRTRRPGCRSGRGSGSAGGRRRGRAASRCRRAVASSPMRIVSS